MSLIDRKKRWFVTGGAGFIGSHVVDLLVAAGCAVTVYDNLSLSTLRYLKKYSTDRRITFHKKDLRDLPTLKKAMHGHDIVWHLAANTDIPSGYRHPRLDLNHTVIGTANVLESMRHNSIVDLLFASTGAVYGETIPGLFKETSGPLLPLSLYGAGKVANEAFIAAYCSLFGLHAWMFRFGNVIGGRTNHGILYDFVGKLRRNPHTLEILGTGRGRKNYFLVEECIHGMLYLYNKVRRGPWPTLFNLGTNSTTPIMKIAAIVAQEMGIKNLRYTYTGAARGWPGDQPVVLLDTSKVHRAGWRAKHSSNQAVRIATRRLLGHETLHLTPGNLR